jgi:hypothetical protein
MPYYNEKRIEVPEHYQGVKWVVEDRHNFNPQNGELVVYGKQGWELIQESNLDEFLVKVGVLKLESNQEIKDGKIATKTRTELIQDGLIAIEEVKESKTSEVNQKAHAKIEGGFESSATGEILIYDTKLEDQFNIKSIADHGIDLPIRCTKKSTGVKDFYPHTKEELAQVVGQFTEYKMGILIDAHNYKSLINESNNAIEIDSMEIVF